MDKMLKTPRFYYKIFCLWMGNKRIGAKEYSEDYDSISAKYDDLWCGKMGEYTREMIRKLEFKKNYSLLDLGCGTGFVIKEAILRNEPTLIIGVDISSRMLSVAKRKIDSDRVKFIKADMISALKKMPENQFDIVTCAWGLAYINPPELLREVKRVLKPGGQFAAIFNRKGTIKTIEKAFLDLMKECPEKIKKISNIGLRLPKGAISFKKLFLKNGFKWIDGWDGERTFYFKDGLEATDWVINSGSLAGVFQVLNIDDVVTALTKILEKKFMKKGAIAVGHKFSTVIGKLC